MQEQQAQFWGLVNFVTSPIRILINGLKLLLTLVFLVILALVTPVIMFFYFYQEKQDFTHFLYKDATAYRQTIPLAFDGTNPPLASHFCGVGAGCAIDELSESPACELTSGCRYTHGKVPSGWAAINLFGFVGEYGDFWHWALGKEAPMYNAVVGAQSTAYNLRGTLSYLRPDAELQFPDAPKVTVAVYSDPHWGVMPTMADITPEFLMTGLCPTDDCVPERDYHFRIAHELMVPTLTKGQQKAVDELNYTMSDEYWLLEAHKNGIYDDTAVLAAASENRAALLGHHDDMSVSYKVLGGLFVIGLIVASPFLWIIRRMKRSLFPEGIWHELRPSRTSSGQLKENTTPKKGSKTRNTPQNAPRKGTASDLDHSVPEATRSCDDPGLDIAVAFDCARKQYGSTIERILHSEGIMQEAKAPHILMLDIITVIRLIAEADSGLTRTDAELALRIMKKLWPEKFPLHSYVNEEVMEWARSTCLPQKALFLSLRALRQSDERSGAKESQKFADLLRRFIILDIQGTIHPSSTASMLIAGELCSRIDEIMGRKIEQVGDASSGSDASRTETNDETDKDYATLGVRSDATDEEVKTAYRDLVKIWHPDRFDDGDTRLKKKAEEQLKTINEAYAHLEERHRT
jgi:DnaJ-domain-containing protein 1